MSEVKNYMELRGPVKVVKAIYWNGSNVLEVVRFAPHCLSFKAGLDLAEGPSLYYTTIGDSGSRVPVTSWIVKSEGDLIEIVDTITFHSKYAEDTQDVDLIAESWVQMTEAVAESKWIPKEYVANDWLADVCRFLREGPEAFYCEDGPNCTLSTGVELEFGKLYLVSGSRRTYQGITYNPRDGKRYMFAYVGDAAFDTLFLKYEDLASAVRRIAPKPASRTSSTVHSNRTERAGTIIGNEQWFIEGRPEADTVVDIRYEDQTVIRGISMHDVSWKSRPQSLGVHKTVNRVKWWRYSDV